MTNIDDLLRPTPKITKRQKQTRTLIIDLERLPGLAVLWEPKVSYVAPANWRRWPETICFAARWYGDKAIEFWSTWSQGRDAMIRRSWELYNEADVVVTYNGVSFDNRHFRSDWLTAGMVTPRPWKDCDLYLEVRRQFGFESKSLEQVSRRLGLKGKHGAYSIQLAEAAIAGDISAQATLERYNRGDIDATQRVYERLKGWLPGHPIVGDVAQDGDLCCTQCGSGDLKRNGWYRAQVNEYAQYRCRNCGANLRSTIVRRISNTRSVR